MCQCRFIVWKNVRLFIHAHTQMRIQNIHTFTNAHSTLAISFAMVRCLTDSVTFHSECALHSPLNAPAIHCRKHRATSLAHFVNIIFLRNGTQIISTNRPTKYYRIILVAFLFKHCCNILLQFFQEVIATHSPLTLC